MSKKDYEQHFGAVLHVIAHSDSLKWLQRNSEKRYGLSYFEALEMAYETLQDEAKQAIKGYRRSKPSVASQASLEGEPPRQK